MTRSKAFFLNGGAGRMLCSIPALEKYEEESGDKDFIIVCEGGTDMFKGHPTLHKRAYDPWHKNLFESEIKHRQVVNPEPYQVWEYYNQKCNLSQAFDILLNEQGVRDLDKPFQMQVSALDHSEYLGIIGIGKIKRGSIKNGDQVTVTDKNNNLRNEKVSKIMTFKGLEMLDVSSAHTGDIIAVSGIGKLKISNTIYDF